MHYDSLAQFWTAITAKLGTGALIALSLAGSASPIGARQFAPVSPAAAASGGAQLSSASPISPLASRASSPSQDGSTTASLPEYGLELDLRGLSGMQRDTEYESPASPVIFKGDIFGSEVRIRVDLSERQGGWPAEPEDVADFKSPITLDSLMRAWKTGSFQKTSKKKSRRSKRKAADQGPMPAAYLHAGPYGYVPYAAIRSSRLELNSQTTISTFIATCILEKHVVVVDVECLPEASPALVSAVRDFLENGIRYEGPKRNWEWTDEEADLRWRREVPEDVRDEREKLIRTEHFIILTNSSGGKLFAKKMEECYDEIQEVYPFDEVPERKLMPVFIFQNPDEYHAFLAKNLGWSLTDAAQTAGVAYGDVYVSVYKSPQDPVHIHEATHQIFKNRLRLGGGGSWFQEGVAELMSTRENERRAYAKGRAKKNRQTPFSQFFTLPSLIRADPNNTSGDSGAHNAYLQAASIIDFVRQSRFSRERFQLFIHTIGIVPRSDLASIEESLQRVFEVDIQGFEEEWVKYWK